MGYRQTNLSVDSSRCIPMQADSNSQSGLAQTLHSVTAAWPSTLTVHVCQHLQAIGSVYRRHGWNGRATGRQLTGSAAGAGWWKAAQPISHLAGLEFIKQVVVSAEVVLCCHQWWRQLLQQVLISISKLTILQQNNSSSQPDVRVEDLRSSCLEPMRAVWLHRGQLGKHI
eukprot:GHUV01017567.1.p1 GENE.GHUV01017567.1~~GHUV01017567.1.p1  ORF type:complete len:170 (-),score=32.07 GHUV01017567.1:324-833(-)